MIRTSIGSMDQNITLKEYFLRIWRRVKPYIFIISIQVGFAGMTILAKFALSSGMSPFTLVVYRHIVAVAAIAPFAFVFERRAGRRLTRSVVLKVLLLGFLEPVLDQNLYFLGMMRTSATFTATMSNVVPAITFILAWSLRLESVNLKEMRSIAKVLGTMVSVSGAMVMTLYKGPIIRNATSGIKDDSGSNAGKDMVEGSIFLVFSCGCYACFMILQSVTLREYPFELTLATLICLAGAVEGAVVAAVIERNRRAAWSLGFDMKLIAIVYAAVICSGMAYCLQGALMKEKGPVFVTAMSPLNMLIVSAAGLLFLGEDLFLGRVIGAIFILLGLYLVVWGKRPDQETGSHQEEQDAAVELSEGAMEA